MSDDRIAQEAALLLDRLVRQGRAFGIHVILGSQTLAGAYSLARSTIGQMAVRIALQCSSADAHLIFSEENTAARSVGSAWGSDLQRRQRTARGEPSVSGCLVVRRTTRGLLATDRELPQHKNQPFGRRRLYSKATCPRNWNRTSRSGSDWNPVRRPVRRWHPPLGWERPLPSRIPRASPFVSKRRRTCCSWDRTNQRPRACCAVA